MLRAGGTVAQCSPGESHEAGPSSLYPKACGSRIKSLQGSAVHLLPSVFEALSSSPNPGSKVVSDSGWQQCVASSGQCLAVQQ